MNRDFHPSKWTAILIVVVLIAATFGFLIWHGVQNDNHQAFEDHQAATAQGQVTVALAQVAMITKQRDAAFQEIKVLVANGELSSARDAANLSKLLAYVTQLNNRDALLFRYLRSINVSVPANLLEPIPVPKLTAATASTAKKAPRPKAKGKPRR